MTVHSAMAQLLSRDIKALAMEVSSHGLHQGRVNGVSFKGAVYTNISRDHLDYHGHMDAYVAAKLELLRADGLQFVAANADDASFAAVRQVLPQSVRLLPYSASGLTTLDDGAVLAARNVRQDAGGLAFAAHWQGEVAQVRAPLFGYFNVDNLLATLAVLLGLDYSLPV
ncbi:Mur ligase family protein, partial [Methylogaea oryzae]|uniref:Mur ligase family protein n=1 Tax=Methylogaea oryzae TaxID=1295382 RepID=UPI0020D1D0DF